MSALTVNGAMKAAFGLRVDFLAAAFFGAAAVFLGAAAFFGAAAAFLGAAAFLAAAFLGAAFLAAFAMVNKN
jgi:hypothetical protein